MRIFGRGSQLGLVLLLAVLVAGFTVSFAITTVLPQALLASIVIACLTALVVLVGTRYIVGRRVLWFAVPALALTGLGAVMLAEDLASVRLGELSEVVIVDHTVDVKTAGESDRGTYTHEYTLERPDGSPIAGPMIYRGQEGYEDFDTGDTITALIDPEGSAPTKPAESINFETDIGILIVGSVAVIGVYGVCALLALFRNSRTVRDSRPFMR